MSLDANVNTPTSNAMSPAAIGQLWDNAGHNLPDFQRLVQMAKSMSAMMQEMETLLGKGAAMTAAAQSAQSATAAEPDGPADHARRVYRERRRRLEIFGDETLFGEPAWDILLDLYVAGEKGKRVAVTSACIGSGVPSTTALRWLNVLEARGLVEREEDNVDARRSFVRLTPRAQALMREYFST